MLSSLTTAQWMELKAWRRIRGPIGADRLDTLFAFLLMNMYRIAAGRADGKPTEIPFKPFLDDIRWFVEAADQPDVPPEEG